MNPHSHPRQGVCGECGSPLEYVFETRMLVCSRCGLVHGTNLIDTGPTLSQIASGASGDSHLGCLVDPAAPGSRWDHPHQTCREAMIEVKRLCSDLGYGCTDSTMGLYLKGTKSGWLRGFGIPVKAAGCAYVAMHIDGHPRCLEEVASVAGCDPRNVIKAVVRIRRGLGLSALDPMAWRRNTTALVDRYCAKLDVPLGVSACARSIVTTECESGCQEMHKGSWSPAGFVAAAIYVAAKRNGLSTTVREISDAMCIDMSTIGRHVRSMRIHKSEQTPDRCV